MGVRDDPLPQDGDLFWVKLIQVIHVLQVIQEVWRYPSSGNDFFRERVFLSSSFCVVSGAPANV